MPPAAKLLPLIQAGLGYGELMEDPAVAAAHVLVVVGTDHELPPGLRTGNLFAGNTVTVTAGAGAGSAAAASAAQDEDTINAGSITCVIRRDVRTVPAALSAMSTDPSRPRRLPIQPAAIAPSCPAPSC